MLFRYALNASTIRTVPLLEKIRIAADAGYTGIELWHAEIDEFLDAGGQLRTICHALDDAGLLVPTTIMLKGWCEPDSEAGRAGMTECRRRMEQSARLGAAHAIAGPPHGPVDLGFVADRYRRLLEAGLELGVRPSVEYLGIAASVNTIAAARTIMERAQHPDATIVLDPFHDFRGGGGHAGISLFGPEQIAVVHFDDAPAVPPACEQRDADRVMPGSGVIPLASVVQQLRQIGYRGWISLELFNEQLWQSDPRDVAREGLQAMRALCEEECSDGTP